MLVVVADPIHEKGIELLKEHGFDVDVIQDKSRLTESLKNADGLIVRSATKVTKELLENAPKLKVVGRAGVGLDNIDRDACKERNIEVVNSPEGPTISVAEFTLGLIIASARQFSLGDTSLKNGVWAKKKIKGIELHGKTLGVIGTGAIGGTVVKYALALGMDVLGYDVYIRDDLKALDRFRYVELEELIRESDVITLHVPLIPATKHMINKETLSQMKGGVIIVNAARGGIIDEEALLDALNSGKVKAAALDVYESEPDPNPELVKHPNVLATPHIGAVTFEAQEKNALITVKKVVEVLSG